uniref:REPAT2 n=1 Tax=Mamestra configurata TaxID=174822 RepID=F6K721_9NEOP|nr:REPAT2 [Mamestra configurata]
MKSFILIAVLAALTVCNNGASIPEEAALFGDDASVYQEGSIGRLGEVLFYDRLVSLDSWPNAIKVWDLEFNGAANTTITGIRIYNPPVNGNATASPLGTNHTVVKLVTARGGHISSRIQIFGRL